MLWEASTTTSADSQGQGLPATPTTISESPQAIATYRTMEIENEADTDAPICFLKALTTLIGCRADIAFCPENSMQKRNYLVFT